MLTHARSRQSQRRQEQDSSIVELIPKKSDACPCLRVAANPSGAKNKMRPSYSCRTEPDALPLDHTVGTVTPEVPLSLVPGA